MSIIPHHQYNGSLYTNRSLQGICNAPQGICNAPGKESRYRGYLARADHIILELHPDIGGAVTTGIPHLVSTSGTGWLFAKVNIEMFVDLQATIVCVTINLQQVGTSLGNS